MPELSAPAPAKINLVLEVLGRRPDGYHEIDTILQELELADRVSIAFDLEPGVTVTGPRAAGVPADETNGAWRAAAALALLAGESIERLHISIDKQIPAAAGLGGGSSNAATALRLLQRAWPHSSEVHLLEAALAVGSDEAFFLQGGTARASGRGEQVTPLPPLPRHGVVLLLPPFSLERKTARLFSALGATPFDRGGRTDALARSLPRPLATRDIYNAFERVAWTEFPGLASLRTEAESRLGHAVRLSGAGPTLFWIRLLEETAPIAALLAGLDCEVVTTATAAAPA